MFHAPLSDWIQAEHLNEAGLNWLAEVHRKAILASSGNRGDLEREADERDQEFKAATTVAAKRKLFEKDGGATLARVRAHFARLDTESTRDALLEPLSDCSESSHLGSLFGGIKKTRERAQSTRRALAISLLVVGVALLVLNLFAIPFLAETFNERAASPLEDSISALESELKTFEATTTLKEQTDSIGALQRHMDNLRSDLAGVVSSLRDCTRVIAASDAKVGESEISLSPLESCRSELSDIADRWSNYSAESMGRPVRFSEDGAEEGSAEANPQVLDAEPVQLIQYMSTRTRSAVAATGEDGKELPDFEFAGVAYFPTKGKAAVERLPQRLAAYERASLDGDPNKIDEARHQLHKCFENAADYEVDAESEFVLAPLGDVLVLEPTTAAELEQLKADTDALGNAQQQLAQVEAAFQRFLGESELLLDASTDDSAGEDSAEKESAAEELNLLSFHEELSAASTSMASLASIGGDFTKLEAEIQGTISRVDGAVGLRETISAIVTPYSYVVLALAAMFLTVGLQLLVRWSKGAEEELVDNRSMWRSAALLDQAAIWRAAGADPTPFILAATGAPVSSGLKDEDHLVPSPLMSTAKEGAKIIQAVRK